MLGNDLHDKGVLAAAGTWQQFISRLVKDIGVYGFLLLLVLIGLYGLFAPQVNTIVQTAAATAAPGLGAKAIGKRAGEAIRRRVRPKEKE